MKTRGTMAILALAAACMLYGYTARATATVLPAAIVAGQPDGAPRGETERIQAHLEEVERELLARDVSHLSDAQRAARAMHISVLREYRQRGVFPHNHDFPEDRVPYFVDEHGTLCAMAHLISRSGHDELVQRVARTRNNARIAELAADPELIAWLEEAGLSEAEAARIQPAYGECCWVGPYDDPNRVSADYALASVLASSAGGLSIGMNLLPTAGADRARWPGLVGIGAGAAGLGLGLHRLGDGGDSGRLGAVNAGIGAVSMAVGAWRLLGPSPARASLDSDPQPGRAPRTLTASPLVGNDAAPSVGVLLRLEF